MCSESYGLGGALAAQTLDLAVTVNLVVLEDGEFGLFALVLDLLGGGVDLLFALLATTTQAEHEVKGGLLLDVVVRKSTAVLELLASEDQTLLVRGDALLVCGIVRSMFVRYSWSRACLPWILDLTLSMVSDDSTSRVIVLPVTARPSVLFSCQLLRHRGYSRVLTKICIVPGQLAVLGLTVADAWSEEELWRRCDEIWCRALAPRRTGSADFDRQP